MANDRIFALDARQVRAGSTGDSTYWEGLLHGLARLEFEETILLLSNAPRPAGIPEDPRFRWMHVPARSSRWWSIVQFPLAARRAGARAIHTQYTLSPLVRDRGLTTVHDISFLLGPDWFSFRDRAVFTRTVPRAIRRARRVLAVSETGRKEIERFFPEAVGKTVVTRNACPPWVRAVERRVAQRIVAERFGFTEPYLMTIGTRWPRKNLELAIDAVEGLPSELPHRLLIVGKQGGEGRAGSRCRATGYVEDDLLGALYSGAEMLLVPSRHEGFGIPVLEAFRCGCPVMSTNGGALPEVVDEAGVVMTEWLPERWSARLAELLPDSGNLERLREAGRAREALFHWEDAAQVALDAYRHVAA